MASTRHVSEPLSIYTFLFIAAVFQRDLTSALMQNDEDLSNPLADGAWVEEAP